MQISADIEAAIRKILADFSYPSLPLRFLGQGNEGCIFETADYLLKYFPDKNVVPFASLKFMKENIVKNPNVGRLRPLIAIFETDTELLFVSPNEHCMPYGKGDVEGTLEVLADAYRNRYVHLNFKPENLMYSEDGTLKLIDLGRDIVPFEPSYFRNMAERAFLTAYCPCVPDLKERMTALSTKDRNIDEKLLDAYLAKLSKLLTISL